MESYQSDICRRTMTLSPLHLIVDWPVFTIAVAAAAVDAVVIVIIIIFSCLKCFSVLFLKNSWKQCF